MLNELIFMIPVHFLVLLPLVILALINVNFTGFTALEQEPEFFKRRGTHGHQVGFADRN